MDVAADQFFVSKKERDGSEQRVKHSLIMERRAAVDRLAGVESLSSLQASPRSSLLLVLTNGLLNSFQIHA